MQKELPPRQDRTRTNEYWVELDRKYRLQARKIAPIVLERGKGTKVWDVEGKEYLDFQSGQMSLLCGHSHPRILQAIDEQKQLLMQIGSRLINIPRIRLAQKLAEIAGEPFQVSYFCSTGAESCEAALRLAKKYTGRFDVIALLRGFHGRTLGSASYSSDGLRKRAGYGPGVYGATFIPSAYCYRCPFKENPPCSLACLDYAEEIIQRTSSGEPAALIMEPIIGSGGVIVPPIEWMKAVRKMCNRLQALLIFDEALLGVGRTGKWFAFQHFEVVPDILVTTKGLGQGIPLGAVVTSERIANEAVRKGHVQSATHIGDPFQCAVGLANIGVIEDEKLLSRALTMGAYLKEGLKRLQARCDVIGDVRGLGLFLGIEVVESRKTKKPSADIAQKISDECDKMGLLLGEIGDNNVLRLAPPLVITEDEIVAALGIMERALQKLGYLSQG